MTFSLFSTNATARTWLPIVIFTVLACVPVAALAFNDGYLIILSTRIVAFAIAALALDLILGYGAMVSFGHAAYIGIGAYTVGISMRYGVTDFLAQIFIAGMVSALFAAITGAISLRTRGIYFIMITLAFGQMTYFFFVSLAAYGGDDGTNIPGRSTLFGTRIFDSNIALFYASLLALVLLFAFARAVVHSRFGRVLVGTRENDTRMLAIGYETFRYRLTAYVLSGAIASVAGVILANQAEFISPAYMSWQRSGDLMVMVVLGGMGNLTGALVGSIATLLLEDWFSLFTHHWRLPFGILLVFFALTSGFPTARNLFERKEAGV